MHNILENYIDYFIDNNIELTREQVEILYEGLLKKSSDKFYDKMIKDSKDCAREAEDIGKFADEQVKADPEHFDTYYKDASERIDKLAKEHENGQRQMMAKRDKQQLAKGALTATGVAAAAYGGKKLYDYYKRKKLENKVQGK